MDGWGRVGKSLTIPRMVAVWLRHFLTEQMQFPGRSEHFRHD